MGDRVLIVFKRQTPAEVSPVVYIHWGGEAAPKLLEKHKEYMIGRYGDVEYAAARFVGLAHQEDPNNNRSLGMWNVPKALEDAIIVGVFLVPQNDKDAAEAEITAASHGDGGVVVVDVDSYEWKAYGGYLKRYNHRTGKIEEAA